MAPWGFSLLLVALTACGPSSAPSDRLASPSSPVSSTSPRSATHGDATPQPCTFLTQSLAAQITGDASITIQATDVAETITGYAACIYADTGNEANNVSVEIKRTPGTPTDSMVQAAALFFTGGEPVQPFQPFAVDGIGDRAVGESTLGVAFIVFSEAARLVYVGAGSASLSAKALEGGVEALAARIAAASSPLPLS